MCETYRDEGTMEGTQRRFLVSRDGGLTNSAGLFRRYVLGIANSKCILSLHDTGALFL